MNRFQHVAAPALVVVSVVASAVTPAFAKVNEYEGQHRDIIVVPEDRKVNEYEGQHDFILVPEDRKVNEYEGQHDFILVPEDRKVNEYEGQHRSAVAGDPSQWAAGDPSQWGYAALTETAF